MKTVNPRPFEDLDEDAALRTIVEGTATETGERFFTALVAKLCEALGTHAALLTEYVEKVRRARTLAFWVAGESMDNYEYDVVGTPCEVVLDGAQFLHHPDEVQRLYPADEDVRKIGAVSYMGVPLKDVNGKVLGHLAVMDSRPMPKRPRALALFRIFGNRAAAELQRLRAEREIHEREERLANLINGAMDAIIELDRNLCVTRFNPAAEQLFCSKAGETLGHPFLHFLTASGGKKLTNLIEVLDARTEETPSIWIPGGLKVRRADNSSFQAEATLSQFTVRGEVFHTLILRDVQKRIEAERQIHELTAATQYLEEEIKELHNFDEIIGRSPALQRVMDDVRQVAETDTTVLIFGETGTGKELIARAVHSRSRRREKPLIKVNCAAIPANLMESEFFGHVKGAFTGATGPRDGRFALADGGTIFLDEVGELPLELQAKLLRVLQEGEFEPVGGSQTKKVDVRVIAATNRDLARAVEDNAFREDLYYRLNVFPIAIPPLRERREDIPLLCAVLAERYARKLGLNLEPLSEEDVHRLKSYSWPGNVRELQNVIERAVITARDGCLNLSRALPEFGTPSPPPTHETGQLTSTKILTVRELRELEHANLIAALERCNWKISGAQGASQLLGMKPSTLSSRMKALRVARPK